ncbi:MULTISPECIES: hypothetical protein [unclassified Chamaesiphon]|uniref:hypothetical protein n=1 Tax=unclassified Chamaesiphon TaxID=2620921 RepID=UPI00286AB0D3|nr:MULTISPECIES: hypothetical protein [unclassified Chamaesiphon]
MKNSRADAATTAQNFHSIELSDTLAASISGGMSVVASASSDSSEATSSEMTSAIAGSGLNVLANDSIGQGKSFTLSLPNEPTITADVLVQDLAIGRFDFKNPKLKFAFAKFLVH